MVSKEGDGVAERIGNEPPSRWLAVALCVFPGGGTGHYYLGRKRRAVLWAVLPLTLYAAYLVLLLRAPLAGLYWTFALVFAFLMVGLRGAMALDVLLLRAHGLRRASWLSTALFGAASLGIWISGQFLLRAYVFEPFRIASAGMEPSLLAHEHVVVDKAAFRGRAPERGELVVLTSPEDARFDYVGRVVALPGDRLEVVAGRPFLNGWAVPRCPLGTVALPDHPELTGQLELELLGSAAYLVFLREAQEPAHDGLYEVAPGEVWVLGDNRNDSADSRAWQDGHGAGAPFENLRGRPAFAWLTFKPNGYPDLSRYGADLKEPRLPAHLQHLNGALQGCLARRPARTTPP